MATLALDPPGEGTEGLPLQLTTITVAVPQPLSPGTVSVLQGGDCGAAQGFKWKYEQPKPEKQGSTLVSILCRGAIGRLNEQEERRGVNDRQQLLVVRDAGAAAAEAGSSPAALLQQLSRSTQSTLPTLARDTLNQITCL